MKQFYAAVLLCLSTANLHADPRSHYLIHCMGCHMQDGSGSPPDVPRFDARLLELMTKDEGRAYLVQVPGSSQAPISDAELAAVLNWILKEYAGFEPSATVAPLSEQEVTLHRRQTLLDPVKTRSNMQSK